MATAVKLKMINTERIRAEMKSLDTYTKNTLAAATGLSVATCGNILNELLEAGEVFEAEQAESTGGRPSRQFVYNKDFAYVMTLYLRIEDEKKIVYNSVSNLAGEIIHEKIDEYNELEIETVDKTINDTVSEFEGIQILAVGVPGVVKDGIVGVCDCSIFSGFNVKEYYEKKYDFEVVVTNDVNCIAYGYYSKHNYYKHENLVYIYYPLQDGPGAGIIIDGKVLHGETNFAGEVGNLPHYAMEDSTFETSKFTQNVLKTIMCINIIINPKTIVLSGLQLNDEIMIDVKKLMAEHIQSSHIPSLEFERDMHDSYSCGLTSMALKQLTYEFKI